MIATLKKLSLLLAAWTMMSAGLVVTAFGNACDSECWAGKRLELVGQMAREQQAREAERAVAMMVAQIILDQKIPDTKELEKACIICDKD